VHLGFGYDELIKTNTAWIISRMHIEFIDTPQWREQVTLTTWHKGLNRLFYLRDFIMTDAQGNPKVKATSSWLVLNLETRRLVRDPELMEDGTVNAEDVIETPADKVQMPKDVEPVLALEHIVAYSDVDMNAHANNAMYMQWAMDAVEYDLAASHPLKELTINFNHETKAGDKVMIYRAEVAKEDGIHVYVEGKVEGTSSFTVELIF
jgi:acyl-ACP thioesterase